MTVLNLAKIYGMSVVHYHDKNQVRKKKLLITTTAGIYVYDYSQQDILKLDVRGAEEAHSVAKTTSVLGSQSLLDDDRSQMKKLVSVANGEFQLCSKMEIKTESEELTEKLDTLMYSFQYMADSKHVIGITKSGKLYAYSSFKEHLMFVTDHLPVGYIRFIDIECQQTVVELPICPSSPSQGRYAATVVPSKNKNFLYFSFEQCFGILGIYDVF